MRICFQSVILLILVVIPGCAAQTSTEAVNSERAKYILETALDAWRTGRPGSLAARKPAIRFVDDDQRAGMELLEYGYEDEEEVIKPYQNVAMVLWVRDRNGQTFEKRATYQVGVEPTFTVLRSDH